MEVRVDERGQGVEEGRDVGQRAEMEEWRKR